MTKKLKKKIRRIIIGAAIAVPAYIVSLVTYEWIAVILFVAAYLVLAIDILKQAGVNIIHGRVFDENFLMTVATFGAFACREYVEAVAVILLYQIGEAFQSYAVNKSRKSVKALMSIRPDFARVIRDHEELEVDPYEVQIGEEIIIKPGERIALDGMVLDGNSSVDTSAITGESLPREVLPGDAVVSGCVNLSGVITVEVTSEFSKSTVSRVLELVEAASSKKSKSEQFITVFAKIYTPIVVGCALALVLLGTLCTKDFFTWLYRGMTFLLISCPCALVISIPLSFFGGIGGAGRKGILIKGGNYIDALAKIDTLVLDKTGTITKGNFAISDIEVSDYFASLYKENAPDVLLEAAALSESYSNHPIALSIIERYNKKISDRESGNDIKDFAGKFTQEVKEIAGKGVEAHIKGNDADHIYHVGNRKLMSDVLKSEDMINLENCRDTGGGNTIVYVAVDGYYAGHIHITDEIKEDTPKALSLCRKAGISNIIMLTGDNEATASVIASKVGVDRFLANLSPLDKVTAIEDILKEAKGKVAFAGDGINDAPVIVRSDVGFAMGAMGSDAAIEAADVVIMTDELSKIPEAKRIALKTLRIVKENIVFALGIKIIVLILAAFGFTSMWAAIFADVGVAFLAIINAMRALK